MMSPVTQPTALRDVRRAVLDAIGGARIRIEVRAYRSGTGYGVELAAGQLATLEIRGPAYGVWRVTARHFPRGVRTEDVRRVIRGDRLPELTQTVRAALRGLASKLQAQSDDYAERAERLREVLS